VLGLGRFVAQTQVGQAERTTARAALEAALKDETSGARLAAAEALALAGEPNKGLPVLIEAMESPQESVRIQAVAALAKLGPAARPALATLKAATTDSSEYVKRISSRALAQLGEP
jgi:HEAT repeat protein